MTSPKLKIHPTWSLRDVVYRMVDITGILSGLVVAAELQVEILDEFYLLAGAGAIIIYYLLGEITGMYRNWRGVAIEREILCTVLTWVGTMPFLLAASVMTRHAAWVDRTFIVTWTLLSLMTIVSIRILVRLTQCFLRSRGFNTKGFAIVGINELGFDLANRIEAAPELGLKLTGFYDDRDLIRLPEMQEDVGHKIGTIEELVRHAREGQVNMIYIALPMRAEGRIKKVLTKLGDTTASVYIVPDFFVFELLHSRWTNISGMPAVSVFENPFYGIDGLLKRAFDLIVAALVLIAVAVPMVVIGVLVKLSSPGPIFYRQRRYGLDGEEISVWKFRSMRVCESASQMVQATQDDPRVTRVGAVLRKTSLDELPQLFNVLGGSMSLVGPRPHASLQNEEYRTLIQGYMLRHKVKPGITGLAQVNGWRGETDTLEKMEKRVECDHQYIRDWSISMDLKILFKTIFVVFSGQNAY